MFRFILFLLIVIISTYTVAAPNVSQLLRECKQHLKANRLTSGKEGTALSCYQEVLKIEPANKKAIAGLKTIEKRYGKWAKRALQKGQKNKVKQYLTSLHKVNPQSLILREFEANLQPPPSTKVAPTVNKSVAPPKSTELPSSPPTDEAATAKVAPTINKSVTPSKSNELVSSPPTDETATPSSISEVPPPPPKKIQVIDVGQIYELINTTDCLTWPTPEMKEKGGKNGWEEFYPKKGDTGMLVKEMQHCHLDDNVYIVGIEQYYVPISSVGVKVMENKLPASTENSVAAE